MGLIRSFFSNLRTDPRLLKFPPYLSLLCMLGGIIWIALLPLDEYSRRTYISENALLPGQVHTYFHGSEQNIQRAYRHEVASVLEPRYLSVGEDQPLLQINVTEEERNGKMKDLFRNAGLKSATQSYSYTVAGTTYTGENVYAVLHAPRGDGTEAIVLVAPIRNIENQLNVRGVTLLLGLGRYFSRWSLWSKDIILLVTPDSTTGPQAWVDAYHSQHDSDTVGSLTLKSGAIQGAVCIDFPVSTSFHTLHIAYDGINGQLPNLDLINTAISIASSQMGIATTIQSQHLHTRPEIQHHYPSRLKALFSGMTNQALGLSTGAHSVFMPYHIDAITLTAVGEGWQDEMAFGRTVESITRSINNLLEKLHQSFFFYILLQNTRFVSIGTYLPSAMAVGAGFTVMAIYLWVKGGYEENSTEGEDGKTTTYDMGKIDQTEAALSDPNIDNAQLLGTTVTRKPKWRYVDRPIVLPIALLSTLYLASAVPLFLLTKTNFDLLVAFAALSLCLFIITPLLATIVTKSVGPGAETPAPPSAIPPKQTPPEAVDRSLPGTLSDIAAPLNSSTRTVQFHLLLKSMTLLILGLQLTVLATLNFSLSIFLGIVCSPLAFVGYVPVHQHSSYANNNSSSSTWPLIQSTISVVLLLLSSPPIVTIALAAYAHHVGFPTTSTSTSTSPSSVATTSELLRTWLGALSFAWNVNGSWGVLIGVFCVWTPAWIIGGVGVLASFLSSPTSSSGTGQADGKRVSIDLEDVQKRVAGSVEQNVEKVKAVVQEGVDGVGLSSQSKADIRPGSGSGAATGPGKSQDVRMRKKKA